MVTGQHVEERNHGPVEPRSFGNRPSAWSKAVWVNYCRMTGSYQVGQGTLSLPKQLVNVRGNVHLPRQPPRGAVQLGIIVNRRFRQVCQAKQPEHGFRVFRDEPHGADGIGCALHRKQSGLQLCQPVTLLTHRTGSSKENDFLLTSPSSPRHGKPSGSAFAHPHGHGHRETPIIVVFLPPTVAGLIPRWRDFHPESGQFPARQASNAVSLGPDCPGPFPARLLNHRQQ
jgi:hypothetical protein